MVTPPSPRALDANELAKKLLIYGKPTYVCNSVADGVKKAVESAGADGTVLAFGSLYMIGDIKNTVNKIKK